MKPLMQQILAASTIAMVMVAAMGCRKDPPPAPAPTAAPPKQYGIPFSGVPVTADIQMYQVNPRVFSAAQNLAAITARLDSIQRLGINVLWLMPIHPTGVARGIGSPYCVRDYYAIHPDYGNLNDLRSLTDRAHELGIAVILDWVANHTAWDHPWINNRSWYTQTVGGDIVHPPGTTWSDVADLNYDNAAMRQAMIQAMKYWALEANIDGYRCDYAAGVPVDFWRQALDTLRSLPGRRFIMFAESDDKSLLTAGFDLLFGWPFYGRLRQVLSGTAAHLLYPIHQSEYNGLGPEQHIVRWITNHDEHAWDNIPQVLFQSTEGSLAAFALVCGLGGVPLLYNGQEVAVPYQLPFFEGHDVTINWHLNPHILTAYQQLLQARRHYPVLRRGEVGLHFSSTDVVGVYRTSGSQEALILVNVRSISRPFTLPSSLSGATWHDVFTQEPILWPGSMTLAPYEYHIWVR